MKIPKECRDGCFRIICACFPKSNSKEDMLARIAALEAELAETKYAYCHRPREQRCGNPDICSACQPFEGQIKTLRAELTLALSQRDKAVEALRQIGYAQPASGSPGLRACIEIGRSVIADIEGGK